MTVTSMTWSRERGSQRPVERRPSYSMFESQRLEEPKGKQEQLGRKIQQKSIIVLWQQKGRKRLQKITKRLENGRIR